MKNKIYTIFLWLIAAVGVPLLIIPALFGCENQHHKEGYQSQYEATAVTTDGDEIIIHFNCDGVVYIDKLQNLICSCSNDSRVIATNIVSFLIYKRLLIRP